MRILDWINRRVGIGLLISLLLCAVGAALGAFLMGRELLDVASAGKWMSFTWLPASFFGSKAALRNAQSPWPHAALQAAILTLAVWAAALATNAVPSFRINGCYILGGIWAGAALTALMPKKKRKRVRRKSGPLKKGCKGH